jgi:tRNA(His) 5'-end guanylyltransferase
MTTMAERMKRYEHAFRSELPRRSYMLLRLDGRAFHSYTRGMKRPFDEDFIDIMNSSARSLCSEITGTRLAYVQSDEISLLVTDFQTHETEPWMGGNLQKIVSLSAAIVSVAFNRQLAADPPAKPPVFDSRVWTMSDPNEVANYFIWRQRDCVKNSITMAAQAYCSHKELDRLNSNERQELLFTKHGINWNDYPAGQKRGRVVVKETYAGPEESIRTRWVAQDAPNFVIEPGGFLGDVIPEMPRLP